MELAQGRRAVGGVAHRVHADGAVNVAVGQAGLLHRPYSEHGAVRRQEVRPASSREFYGGGGNVDAYQPYGQSTRQPQSDATGAAADVREDLAGSHPQPGDHRAQERPVTGAGRGDLGRVGVAHRLGVQPRHQIGRRPRSMEGIEMRLEILFGADSVLIAAPTS